MHRMGDVGYFDAEGRLWFCGRKSQRLQTAQGLLGTENVEPIFNCHPAVKRSASAGSTGGGGAAPVAGPRNTGEARCRSRKAVIAASREDSGMARLRGVSVVSP